MTRVFKLKGRRVGLAVLEKRDIKNFYKWVNDLEVTQFLVLFTRNIRYEDEVEWYEEHRKKKDDLVFSIIELKTEKLIGNTGLHNINHINRTAEFGIAIMDKRYWNKGYGTEAVTLMLDYGFNVLSLNSIVLWVYEENKRAQRVYEKVGFRKIGMRREARLIAGKFMNDIYMDILAKEFNKKHKSVVKGILQK